MAVDSSGDPKAAPASADGTSSLELVTRVLGALPLPAFVVDREYRARFMNRVAMQRSPDLVSEDTPCYAKIYRRESPCEMCVMAEALADDADEVLVCQDVGGQPIRATGVRFVTDDGEELVAEVVHLGGEGLASSQSATDLREDAMQAVIDSSADVVLLFDGSYRPIVANRVAQATLGYSLPELADLTLNELGIGKDAEELGKLLSRADAGSPAATRAVITAKSGAKMPVKVSLALLVGSSTRAVGCCTFAPPRYSSSALPALQRGSSTSLPKPRPALKPAAKNGAPRKAGSGPALKHAAPSKPKPPSRPRPLSGPASKPPITKGELAKAATMDGVPAVKRRGLGSASSGAAAPGSKPSGRAGSGGTTSASGVLGSKGTGAKSDKVAAPKKDQARLVSDQLEAMAGGVSKAGKAPAKEAAPPVPEEKAPAEEEAPPIPDAKAAEAEEAAPPIPDAKAAEAEEAAPPIPEEKAAEAAPVDLTGLVVTVQVISDPAVVASASEAIETLLGYSREEVVSWTAEEWFERVHEPKLATDLSSMWSGLVGQRFEPGALPDQVMEYPLVRKDGGVVDCSTTWRAVQAAGGTFEGLEVIIRPK